MVDLSIVMLVYQRVNRIYLSIYIIFVSNLPKNWSPGGRYCLIDKGTMEIMGYAAMTFAIKVLEEICQRLAEFDGGSYGNGSGSMGDHLPGCV